MTHNHLPATWICARLCEVGEIITGGTPATSRAEYYGGSIPFIKPPSLKDRPIMGTSDSLTPVGATHARIVPPHTILVSCIGNLGRTGLTTQETAFNQQINAIVPTAVLDPRFGFYACQLLQSALEGVASATTISIVNKSKFSELTIPLAPFPEQHRIVAEIEKHFTRLDAAVAALERTRANLKRYRAAVLKTACEGRLVPTEAELARTEGRDYEPADQLLARILKERRARWEADQLAKMQAKRKTAKDEKWKTRYDEPQLPDTSALPNLPVGWRWATLPQLGELNRGKSKHRPRDDPRLLGGPYPFIQTGEVKHSGGFIRSHSQTYSEFGLAQSRLWPAGTLCVTIAANIADTGILTYEACFPDSVVGFVFTGDHVVVRYIERFFRTIRERLTHFAPATAQKNINLEVLSDVAIALPPLAEQNRIVAEVERRLSAIDELDAVVDANLKRAERLRQSILKRAFEGKLVPQDPNDEPASVLLERIRAERVATPTAPRHQTSRSPRRRRAQSTTGATATES
ncbi:MAG: restriction endonuclease subunit S [Deltaproteobacteria bacterium]|nr:restriction endonuclease subunit S [Deltaproteobacteria bacterium]MBI3386738.1 restriction endonuclease subunit S [Deltaproteobacteria bacterium]